MLGVFNEDCLQTMSKMPDHCVDLVVTSPPYNLWRNRRTQAAKSDYWQRTNIRYDVHDDKMSDDDYEDWQVAVLDELGRVIKPTGTIAYNHKDRITEFVCVSPLRWIMRSQLIVRQRITWDRGGMQAFNNVRFYRNEEDIYLLGSQAKGFKWNRDAAKLMSIWRISPARKNGHPAAFPEEIPRRLIAAFTVEGDVVYDPFLGSGTTAVVAKQMGRRWVGSELSAAYCELAHERLQGV
jgi:modification methylase